MNNRERAEKIVRIFMGYEKSSDKSFYDQVVVVLDEAVREAWGQDDLDHFRRVQKQGFREGFAAAREKAAGIADDEETDMGMGIPNKIAERIRAMSASDTSETSLEVDK